MIECREVYKHTEIENSEEEMLSLAWEAPRRLGLLQGNLGSPDPALTIVFTKK